MWEKGTPSKVGWYLCAWKKGEGYIYNVGKWTGSEWITTWGEPHNFQEITSPTQQDEMLEELYQAK